MTPLEQAREAAAEIVAWALAPEKEDMPQYAEACRQGDFDEHHIVQSHLRAITAALTLRDEIEQKWANLHEQTAMELGDMSHRATTAERELANARQKLRMVVAHASGGRLSEPADVDRSLNDICVEISRNRNMVYQAGKDAAEKEPRK